MGWLSSAASAVGELAGNMFASSKAMKRQFGYQKEIMQNAHQWEVEDLRKAGLNPILSAGGSGASGSVGVVTGAGSTHFNAPSNAKTTQLLFDQYYANVEKTNAETAKLLEEKDAVKKMAEMYSASAQQMQSQTAELKRQLDFYRNNPDISDLERTQKAWPTYGPILYGVQKTVRDIEGALQRNSAKVRSGMNHFRYEDSK